MTDVEDLLTAGTNGALHGILSHVVYETAGIDPYRPGTNLLVDVFAALDHHEQLRALKYLAVARSTDWPEDHLFAAADDAVTTLRGEANEVENLEVALRHEGAQDDIVDALRHRALELEEALHEEVRHARE